MSTADHIRQVMAELDRTLGAVATDDELRRCGGGGAHAVAL